MTYPCALPGRDRDQAHLAKRSNFLLSTRVGLGPPVRRAAGSDRGQHERRGKLFMMYKFRTMKVDAEIDGRAISAPARKRDPRVTSVGGFLSPRSAG